MIATFNSAQRPAEATDIGASANIGMNPSHHSGNEEIANVADRELTPFAPDTNTASMPVVDKVLGYLAGLPLTKNISPVSIAEANKTDDDGNVFMVGAYPEDVHMAAPPNSAASPSSGLNIITATPDKAGVVPAKFEFRPAAELPKRRRFRSIEDMGDNSPPLSPFMLSNRFLLLPGDEKEGAVAKVQNQPTTKAPVPNKTRADNPKGKRVKSKSYYLRSRKTKPSENVSASITKRVLAVQPKNRKPCVEINAVAVRAPNTNVSPTIPQTTILLNRVQAPIGSITSHQNPPKRTIGEAFRRLDELADFVAKVHDGCDKEITVLCREQEKGLGDVRKVIKDCASASEVEDISNAIASLSKEQKGIRADLEAHIREAARDRVNMNEIKDEIAWDVDSLRRAITEHGEWTTETEETLEQLAKVLAGTEENMKQINQCSQMRPEVDHIVSRINEIEEELRQRFPDSNANKQGRNPDLPQVPTLTLSPAPTQSKVDDVVFKLDVIEKSVQRLTTAHNHVVQGFELAAANNPSHKGQPFDTKIIAEVAAHWAWHLATAARATGVPGIERVVDDGLQTRDRQLNDTPSAAAAIVHRAYEYVLFVFTNNKEMAPEDSGVAKAALRLYTVLRPVVSEAITSIDSLSAGIHQDEACFRDAILELVIFLRTMVKAAKVAKISVFFNSTSEPDNTKKIPFEGRLPIITGARDAFLLDYRPVLERPTFFTPSCDTWCRHHPMVLWKQYFIARHPVLGEVNVPMIVSEPFPDLDKLPIPAGDDPIERDTTITAPGLYAAGGLVSWIGRTLVAIAREHTLFDIPTDPVTGKSASYESAIYMFSLLREDVCATLDSFVNTEIAHNNPEVSAVLCRIATYMEQALEYLIKGGGEDGLYAITKGNKASPLQIKAGSWMPTIDFRHVESMEPEDPSSSEEEWDPLDLVVDSPTIEPAVDIL